MCRLLFFVLLTLTSSAIGKEIPLQLLFMIASHHPTSVFCDRPGTVTTYLTKVNVRHVTFTSQLRDGEMPGDLCSCVYQSLRYDKNWLQGATASCESKGGNETIILKGKPDPFYSPNPPKHLDQPLEQMQGLYSRSSKLIFFKTTCYVSFEEDTYNCIHFLMKCTTSVEEIANAMNCAQYRDYFNVGNWLGNAAIYCKENGAIVEMEIVGGHEADDNCTVPLSNFP